HPVTRAPQQADLTRLKVKSVCHRDLMPTLYEAIGVFIDNLVSTDRYGTVGRQNEMHIHCPNTSKIRSSLALPCATVGSMNEPSPNSFQQQTTPSLGPGCFIASKAVRPAFKWVLNSSSVGMH